MTVAQTRAGATGTNKTKGVTGKGNTHTGISSHSSRAAADFASKFQASSLAASPSIPLRPKDFVAILSKLSEDGIPRWILGQVDGAPYEGDVDIRLWDKHREKNANEDEPTDPALLPLLERIKQIREEQQKSLVHASEISTQMRLERRAIMAEIQDANEYVKASKAIMNAARADVDNIPMKHWQELKSYRVAPQMVSAVLRAVMLLLGEDEACTWLEMQKVLRDINFKSRIISYVAEMSLSPERREFIIRECVSRRSFRYDRAMKGSLAIGPIYYWVLAQLDSGEAFTQKYKLDKEKVERQQELRAMLRQVHQQAAAISEHQALMDDLDDELRAVHQQTTASLHGTPSYRNSKRNSLVDSKKEVRPVTARYNKSFAGRDGKVYLKPAFFDWQPTNCVLTFLRKTVLCNFGPIPKVDADGYLQGLDDLHVRLLDEAIMERLHLLDHEDDAARMAREMEEERKLESQLLKQQKPDVTEQKESPFGEDNKNSPSPSPATPSASQSKWETLFKTFTGEKWKNLLERRRQDVVDTFMEDSAHCLELPKDCVIMKSMSSDDTLPVEMSVDVQNQNAVPVGVLQSQIDQYHYPKLSALCGEKEKKSVKGPVPSKLQDLLGLPPIPFQGHWWEKILETKRNEVSQTFTVEATEALELTPPQSVSISSTKAGPAGIEFSYVVRQSPHSASDAIWRITSFAYPKLWALYDRVSEELERADEAAKNKVGPPQLTKVFEGADWNMLLRDRENEVKEAFVQDESQCLKISPKQVEIRQMYLRPAGELVVAYDLKGDVRGPKSVAQESEKYDYPCMWGLYEDIGFVITSHVIGFEGEGWEDVVNHHYAELERRFISCTVNVLGLYQGDVRNLRFILGSLYVHFDLHHSITLQVEEIDEKLRDYPYLPVWELLPASDDDTSYGEDMLKREDTLPPDGETTKSSHELGFDGSAWGEVLNRCPLRVKEVVIDDTKEALRSLSAPQEVSVSRLQFADESLVANVDVTLPTVVGMSVSQHHEAVQQALEEGTFSRVWDLLETNTEGTTSDIPKEGAEKSAVPRDRGVDSALAGILERRFPGDGWESVLHAVGDPAVERAFQEDVSEIVGVPPEDIVVEGFRIGSLIVSYRIRNLPETVNGDEIKKQLQDEYRFPRIQSLYKLRASQLSPRKSVNTTLPGSFPASPTSTFTATRDFYGPKWTKLVQNHLPLLQRLAIRDIANARGCPESAVELQPMELLPSNSSSDYQSGLKLMYDVNARSTRETKSDFDAESSRYTFPLLQSLNASSIPNDVVTNAYTVHFDAKDWSSILQESREELSKALSMDTAEVCLISPADVLDVDFHTDYNALTASMCIRQNINTSRKQMEKKLFLSTFPRVWAIYGHSTVTDSEFREFIGEDWSDISKAHEAELQNAFARDTSNALDGEISPSDVVVQSVQSNPRGCCVKYLLPNKHFRLSPTEVGERLYDDKRYPLVWALYDRYKKPDFIPPPPTTTPQPSLLSTKGIRCNKEFPGDRWKERLVDRRQAVSEAFQKDVQQAFHRYSGEEENHFDVTVFSLEADTTGLTARCVVVEKPASSLMTKHVDSTPPGTSGSDFFTTLRPADKERNSSVRRGSHSFFPLSEVDVNDALSTYNFPLLWEVYYREETESDSEPEFAWSAPLHRRFEGKHWGAILQNRSNEVNDAFKKGVADSSGLPHSNVEIMNIREGSLLVDYRVLSNLPAHVDLDALVQKHPFPELMALHPPPTPRSRTSSLPRDRAAPPVPLSLSSRASLQLFHHEVEFNGSRWREVMQSLYPELSRALQLDVADCLRCSPDILYCGALQMRESNTEGEEQLHVVVQEVYQVPLGASEEDVKAQKQILSQKLKAYNFPRMWALYPKTPVIPAPSTAPCGLEPFSALSRSAPSTTNASDSAAPYQIAFEDPAWKVVLQMIPDRLQQSIKQDVARCLSLPEADNVGVTNLSVADGQTLNASVRIPNYCVSDTSNSSYGIKEKLNNYSYPTVWSLLDTHTESAIATKVFPGDRWPTVATQQRDDVCKAFQSDICEMTALPDQYVSVRSVSSNPKEGLTVKYLIHGNFYPVERVTDAATSYHFPYVWSLYPQTSDTLHRCECSFPGAAWPHLLERNGLRGEVEKAFLDDMREGFPSLQTVSLQSLTTTEENEGQLNIIFSTNVPPNQCLQFDKQVQRHSFPRVWDLYRQCVEGEKKRPSVEERSVANAVNPAQPLRSGEVQSVCGLTFQGPDWGYVWERSQPHIGRVLQKEVGRAAEVSPSAVSVTSMKRVPTGMLVGVSVRYLSSSMTREDLTSRLQHYPYPEFWSFYERPPQKNRMQTRTKLFFEGPNWRITLFKRGDRTILDTFVAETAELLSIPTSSVQEARCDVNAEGLSVWCVVSNTPQTAVAELNTKAYPRMWKLYVVDSSEAKGQKLLFEGNWRQALKEPNFQRLGREAVQEDVGAALHVAPQEVKVDMIVENLSHNLVVLYQLPQKVFSHVDVERTLCSFSFPKVWALLLLPLQGKTVTSGPLQRKFEGPLWHEVLDCRRADAHEAFAKGVSDCCGVPPQSVDILDVRTGSLIVDYRIRNPPVEDAVLDGRVQQHPFPELMALHPPSVPQLPKEPLRSAERSAPAEVPKSVPPVPLRSISRSMPTSDMVESELRKEFLGRGWVHVLSDKRPLLEAAFQEDTALALSVPVDAIRLTSVVPGVTLTCVAQHPSYRTKEELQSIVRDYPYDKVWGLYEDREVTSSHELFFYAPNWHLVKVNNATGLHNVLRSSGSTACNLPIENVLVSETEAFPERLKATLTVTHPIHVDSATLDEMLQNYPYNEVWALLDQYAGNDFTDDNTTETSSDGFPPTAMVRLFPGKAWEAVSRFHHSAVRSAFIQDTSDCLEEPAKDINVLSMLTTPKGLSVHFTAANRSLEQKSETMHVVRNAPYPRVWALYEEWGEDRKSVPIAPPSSKTVLHTLLFPGSKWKEVVDDIRKRAALTEAIQGDSVKALGGVLPSSAVGLPQISMEENAAGGPVMIAKVPVRYPPERNSSSSRSRSGSSSVLNEESNNFDKYERLLRHFPFSTVWALYPKASRSPSQNVSLYPPPEFTSSKVPPTFASSEGRPPAESAITPWLSKTFPGADWKHTFDNSYPQLQKAFVEDASEATGVSPADVEIGRMELGSLVVGYRLHHHRGSPREVEQQMEAGSFPRVWALYRPQRDTQSTGVPLSSRSALLNNSSPSQSLGSSQQLLPPATQNLLLSSRTRPNRQSQSIASVLQREEEARRAAQMAREAEEFATQLAAERSKADDEARSIAQLSAKEKQDAQRTKAYMEEERERANREAAEAAARARAADEALRAAEEAARRKEMEASAKEEAARRRAEEAAMRAKAAEDALRAAEEAARRAKENRPPEPLDSGEHEEELDQIQYLRKALSKARAERDDLQNALESGNYSARTKSASKSFPFE